jgi:ergothioneine biosynthesis protein EgtB
MKGSHGVLTPQRAKAAIIDRKELIQRYIAVRSFTHELCKPLLTEDYVVQTMPDVSPAKWHLAHVTWFFETFVLKEGKKDYKELNPIYNFIFNSYYVQVGPRHTRAHRGYLTRPTVKDVYDFRGYIDTEMMNFLNNCDENTLQKLAPVIEIGLNHEQQHQELFVTDIKHVFSVNPLHPVYSEKEFPVVNKTPELKWIKFQEGLYEIGHGIESFCYDNETPKHREFLSGFELGSRLVTNKEYLQFIEDGGYRDTTLWLSDGWTTAEREHWEAPMYWEMKDGQWWNFKLTGLQKVNLSEPVCHISYYEADAYARWAGLRLPTETEWEVAASQIPLKGNFVEEKNFHPIALKDDSEGLQQMYGDVWEWTQSAYSAYPGYKTLPGALGEYNGKFMSGQMVLRGGSCATSVTHIRKTYRNFFYPGSRWQFMGIRLAKDI